ncbi:general negative regulator of transcription subunit 5 [Tieghemiomyces parasiticus]|uniref:General negative regulator of transcription subunit n=1 Tax=Tieghemiomyces parasiticus TaxID=78921 RepID=A0A9W8A1C4_9FUNG|nr:general negative regulator of transcription subunit 5 [Tieghemiomyces parasiticus]
MSSRKLQVEIDKMLKKVAEGIESFDDIFDKLQSAPNINQKEKYEADLKKEIKKLQRHRDQIKTWIASSDIKDKRDLLENRKNIEKKMEAFKACEKEMKTKAYSKEGLSMVAKLDPKEKAKMDMSSWLSNTVDALSTQIDVLELEAEGMANGPKKGKKDSGKAARIREIERLIERHKWHIQRLELILRSMENGRIEPEQIADIQDDVQYYLDTNQDDDFDEDEGIYDELNLDEGEEIFGINEEYYTGPSHQDGTEDKPAKAKEPPTPERGAVSPPMATVGIKTSSKTNGTSGSATATTSPASTADQRASEPPVSLHTTGTTGRSTIKVASGKTTNLPTAFPVKRSSTTGSSGVTTVTSPTKATSPLAAAISLSNGPSPSIAAALDGRAGTKSASLADPAPAVTSTSKPETNAWANANAAAKLAKLASTTGPAVATAQPYSSIVSATLPSTGANSTTASQPTTPVVAQIPSPSVAALRSPVSSTGGGPPTPGQAEAPVARSREGSTAASTDGLAPTPTVPDQAATRFPPLDFFKGQELPGAFSDLWETLETADNSRWQTDARYRTQMTETSFQCLPDLADSEKPRHYAPQNPIQTPSYYPQVPLPIFDSPAMASNFNLDTLFFIFYYQQDTYQHYLAAQELQRQSWRFHKRYLTWFQRFEKPKLTTDEYEVGTYVFFDYEGGWCPHQKTDFKFEYQYLEDTELL